MAIAGRKRNPAPVTTPVFHHCLDATPERLRIAHRDGLETAEVQHLTPAGFKTGTKHRAIVDPIETAMKNGKISESQASAARIFLATLFKADIDGKVTVNLLADGVFGRTSTSISHIRIQALRRVVEASKSLNPIWREGWLDWCKEVLVGRAGIGRLGEIALKTQGKARSKRTGEYWGFVVLKECTADLQRYYGT